MKKIIFAIMATLAFGGAQAQNTTTLTRFEGERITGIEAVGSIDVVLVKSAATKAVMEIDKDLERYLMLERKSDGVVKVWLKDVPNNVWKKRRGSIVIKDGKVVRGGDNGNAFNQTRRLTLHLPELHTARMTGSGDLDGRGAFASADVDIWRSGSGDIELDVSGSKNVKVQRSGSGDIELRANDVEALTLMVSGSGDLSVDARRVGYVKLTAAGSGDVEMEGGSARGDYNIAGSADVDAARFEVGELRVNVAGSADVGVCATDELDVDLAGSGSVRHRGGARVNSNVRGSGSVKAF